MSSQGSRDISHINRRILWSPQGISKVSGFLSKIQRYALSGINGPEGLYSFYNRFSDRIGAWQGKREGLSDAHTPEPFIRAGGASREESNEVLNEKTLVKGYLKTFHDIGEDLTGSKGHQDKDIKTVKGIRIVSRPQNGVENVRPSEEVSMTNKPGDPFIHRPSMRLAVLKPDDKRFLPGVKIDLKRKNMNLKEQKEIGDVKHPGQGPVYKALNILGPEGQEVGKKYLEPAIRLKHIKSSADVMETGDAGMGLYPDQISIPLRDTPFQPAVFKELLKAGRREIRNGFSNQSPLETMVLKARVDSVDEAKQVFSENSSKMKETENTEAAIYKPKEIQKNIISIDMEGKDQNIPELRMEKSPEISTNGSLFERLYEMAEKSIPLGDFELIRTAAGEKQTANTQPQPDMEEVQRAVAESPKAQPQVVTKVEKVDINGIVDKVMGKLSSSRKTEKERKGIY
ncbi:MAG: hypothetical protein N2645_14065 [Clostridia bacterium]|nr:hypothetical protein [Clostridia bacterium]